MFSACICILSEMRSLFEYVGAQRLSDHNFCLVVCLLTRLQVPLLHPVRRILRLEVLPGHLVMFLNTAGHQRCFRHSPCAQETTSTAYNMFHEAVLHVQPLRCGASVYSRRQIVCTNFLNIISFVIQHLRAPVVILS